MTEDLDTCSLQSFSLSQHEPGKFVTKSVYLLPEIKVVQIGICYVNKNSFCHIKESKSVNYPKNSIATKMNMMKVNMTETKILNSLGFITNPFLTSMKYAIPGSGVMFILSEYMPETLFNMMERLKLKRLDLKDDYIIILSRQLMSGLKYLHDLDYAHCNINPRDIFVDITEVRLKISNFFYLRKIGADLPTVTSIGTQLYRAPELFLKNPIYGTFMDVWSAGCVIALMILQKPIFKEDSIRSIFYLIGFPLREKSTNSFRNDPEVENNLSKIITNPYFANLLSVIFDYDYKKRITAAGVLEILNENKMI